MNSLNDPLWKTLIGGYGTHYDPSLLLQRLEAGIDDEAAEAIWQELWDELHHQGDVGTAAYFALPHLLRIAESKPRLDCNYFALATTIELARHQPRNPELPDEVRATYLQALSRIPELVSNHPHREWDAVLTQSILAAVAISKGHQELAMALQELDSDTTKAFLEDQIGHKPGTVT